MKVNYLALMVGGLMFVFLISLLNCSCFQKQGTISSAPQGFYFDESVNPGPKVPRGGDYWESRPDLVK
jgi:hypothetical protein